MTTPRARPTQVPDVRSPAAVTDPGRRRLILVTMCLALVAVIASVSGLNVAQQALAAGLHASQSELLWVVNGYTLALAALLMPVGAVGDRIGRKPVLITGLAIFAGANVAAALVRSPEPLIVLRVIAGIAAAMIMPVTLSVLTTSFPAEERAKAVGTWAGVAGGGGIVGLFASAAIIDHASWPWVFAIPVGLALTALVATVLLVPPSTEHRRTSFDIAGSVLSVAAVGGLVLAIQEGPEQGWTHPVTIAATLVGLTAAAAFARVELGTQEPLLDIRLFGNRALATGSLNLFVVFSLMFALFLVLIQFFQATLGYSALRAAVGMLPMAAMMMPLSTVAPTIAERIGYRRTVVVGMVLLGTGLALIAALVDLDRGYVSVLPGLLVLSSGVGLSMSPSTTSITTSLAEDKQGVASALNDTVRELGGAVGIALIGSVLNARYRSNISKASAGLPPTLAAPVRSGIGGALAVAHQLGPTGGALVADVRHAWVSALRPALGLGALIALGAAVFTACMARGAADDEPTSATPIKPSEPGQVRPILDGPAPLPRPRGRRGAQLSR